LPRLLSRGEEEKIFLSIIKNKYGSK